MLAYSTASFGLFLFAPMAGRIRKLMPHGYTSGDFLRLRYGRPAWAIFMVFTLFYSLTWLVSMAMAGGILLNALSGIPYAWGMSVILLVCVIYTMRGGLAAVIGTDFIQSLIIIVGIVVVGIAVLSHVSVEEIHANLAAERPALLDVLFPAAIMAIFNNLLFGLGEVFHNNVWWSRAFAFREGVGGKAFFLGGLVWFPIPIAAGFIALASGALNVAVPAADMVGPLVVADVLGTFGAIAIFIIVFCSLASSIDSLLAATSDLLTEDVYRRVMNPAAEPARLKAVAQYVTLALGLFTWAVCLPRIGTLASVLFFAGPLVGAMIWPIVTGLYWRSANSVGAVGGMLLGAGVGLVCYFAIGWYVATLIATAVSMIWVLACTRLSKSRFDWAQLSEAE
jgi:Na+/proline symporter